MTKRLGPFRIAVRTEDGWVNGWYQANDPKEESILLFKVRQSALDIAGQTGFDSLMILARCLSESLLRHVMPELQQGDISVYYAEPGKLPEEKN